MYDIVIIYDSNKITKGVLRMPEKNAVEKVIMKKRKWDKVRNKIKKNREEVFQNMLMEK